MNDLNIHISRLKYALDNKSDSAISLLMQLVNDFSNDEKIQTEAALLNAEFGLLTAANREEKDILFKEILELANQVRYETPPSLSNEDIESISTTWVKNRKLPKVVCSCRNICKQYKKSTFQLQDIDVDLKEGEITGVIGENGNGKTTLLKIIAGELSPDSGIITYGKLQEGDDLQWQIVKPKIAYLSQELGRLRGYVRQSIQYSAGLHGITGDKNDKETNYIIQRLGLNKYKNACWEQLSGGYKLRFALAKVLVWKPQLLVLDEPLANLDINTQTRVLNDIRDLSRSLHNPMAVILSSQNIEELESVSDNMIVLQEGKTKFNKPTVRVGERREHNLFEFKTFASKDEVQQKLAGFTHYGLDYNGFSFFIKTSLTVSLYNLMSYCEVNQLELTFLQDVGISVKSLIVRTNLQDKNV